MRADANPTGLLASWQVRPKKEREQMADMADMGEEGEDELSQLYISSAISGIVHHVAPEGLQAMLNDSWWQNTMQFLLEGLSLEGEHGSVVARMLAHQLIPAGKSLALKSTDLSSRQATVVLAGLLEHSNLSSLTLGDEKDGVYVLETKVVPTDYQTRPSFTRQGDR